MVQNIKGKLRCLVECRDKEEALKKLSSLGVPISDSELEKIREIYCNSYDSSSYLSIEQLDKVAGGMKSMGRKRNEVHDGLDVGAKALVAPQSKVALTAVATKVPVPGAEVPGVPQREVDGTGVAPVAEAEQQPEVEQHTTITEQLREVADLLEREGYSESAEKVNTAVAAWLNERGEHHENDEEHHENDEEQPPLIIKLVENLINAAPEGEDCSARLYSVAAWVAEVGEYPYNASRLYKTATEIFMSKGYNQDAVRTSLSAARLFEKTGEIANAEDAYKISAQLLENEGHDKEAADILTDASMLLYSGWGKNGADLLMNAIRLFKKAGNSEDVEVQRRFVAEQLSITAGLLKQDGDYKTAQMAYLEASEQLDGEIAVTCKYLANAAKFEGEAAKLTADTEKLTEQANLHAYLGAFEIATKEYTDEVQNLEKIAKMHKDSSEAYSDASDQLELLKDPDAGWYRLEAVKQTLKTGEVYSAIANTLEWLGKREDDQDKLKEAEKYRRDAINEYSKAAETSEKLGDQSSVKRARSAIAQQLKVIAERLQLEKNHEASAREYSKAAYILREIRNFIEAIELYKETANQHGFASRLLERRRGKKPGDAAMQCRFAAKARLNAAMLLEEVRRPEDAAEQRERTLRGLKFAAEQLDGGGEIAVVWKDLANVAELEGKAAKFKADTAKLTNEAILCARLNLFEKATEVYKDEVQNLVELAEMHKAASKACSDLSEQLKLLGDPDAGWYRREAMKQTMEIGGVYSALANTLEWLGEREVVQNKPEEAEKYRGDAMKYREYAKNEYSKAAETSERLGDQSSVKRARLAIVQQHTAIAKLLQLEKNPKDSAKEYSNAARLFTEIGNLEEAIALYEESANQHRVASRRFGIELGDLEDAAEQCRLNAEARSSAATLLDKVGRPNEAGEQRKIAEGLFNAAEAYSNTVEQYVLSYHIKKGPEAAAMAAMAAMAVSNIAGIFTKIGNFEEEAIALYKKSAERHEVSSSRFVRELGDREDAAEQCRFSAGVHLKVAALLDQVKRPNEAEEQRQIAANLTANSEILLEKAEEERFRTARVLFGEV